MYEFEIKDMTCGHCVQQVGKAIAAYDPQARVKADLATQKVQVESRANETLLRAKLAEAGYPAS